MKRKWLIVTPLLFVEFLVCIAILMAFWGGGRWLSQVRFFQWAGITVEDTHTWAFDVSEPTSLEAETASGDIRVMGADDGRVRVVAHLHRWGWSREQAIRQLRVEVSRNGGLITARPVRPPLSPFGGGEVDFEIWVPRRTTVTLVSTSGALTVSDVTGTLVLKNTSGSVLVDDVRGALSVESVSGAIKVTGGVLGDPLSLKSISGDVMATGVTAPAYYLESTSGDVSLNWCDGSVAVDTVSGDIQVRNCTAVHLQMQSNSGDVSFSGVLAGDEPHRVETVSGDVVLALPADGAFDVRLETISGEIEAAFPLHMLSVTEHFVSGTVNGGGPPVSVETTSGDITLTVEGGE